MRSHLVATGLLLATVSTAASDLVQVKIREPIAGQPAMGSVEVVADVLSSSPPVKVVFAVDGRTVGELLTPPYRLDVDLGLDNRDHRIEVVVYTTAGTEGRASVTTAAVPASGQFLLSLEQLYVTATQGGERVLDLERDDFRVEDKGDAQQVVNFERGDIPFTAVLLTDASISMTGARLDAAIAGISQFVGGMRPLDQACLLAFSDRLLGKTPFTSDPAEIAAELEQTRPFGGTAINDYLYMAIKLLEQRQGRRVIVLLSDGIDSHSVLEMEQVRRRARMSQALLYWIWIQQRSSREFADGKLRSIYSTWHTTDEYRHQLDMLEDTVKGSGGRVIPVTEISEIEPVFVEILEELREQYVLGYYPDNNRDDGRWHRVKVRVRRTGIDLRAHEGYFDF